jgi:hypothetical protein
LKLTVGSFKYGNPAARTLRNLLKLVVIRISFYAMSDPSSAALPNDASTFANLLAALTGNSKRSNEIWDESALLDDVTTISYEQALRSHRRVPAAETLTVYEDPENGASLAADTVPIAGKKRKTASITIRVTESEQAQLHERAVAAQLSISAYLRSCVFEAESLRAQVKEALSQMKTVSAPDLHPPQKSSAGFLSRWLRPRASG